MASVVYPWIQQPVTESAKRIIDRFLNESSQYDIGSTDEDEFQAALATQLVYKPTAVVLPPEWQWIQHSADVGELRVGPKAYIAFRGTNTFGDVLDDISLAVSGEQASRAQRSLETVRKIQQLNPALKYSVTGHSLGGSLADYVASELGVPGFVFNPYLRLTKKQQQVKVISTYTDPVSLLYKGEMKYYHPRKVSGHTLESLFTSDDLSRRLSKRATKKDLRQRRWHPYSSSIS